MTELDALAERAKNGDREALEGLVHGLQDRVYALAVRFSGNREDARDATQEIMILVITRLSTFRGESSVATWVHRIACRHLLRAQTKARRITFEELAENLAQPASPNAPATRQSVDARLLEEEVFLGCTQAMLRALDRDERIAFVLGGICQLESPEAAAALDITEAAFRKRLSRARATLDGFMRKHCGVANPDNPCRCRNQVDFRVRHQLLDPDCLRFAMPVDRTSLEALRGARAEVDRMRTSLDLFGAQPTPTSPDDLVARVRAMLEPGANPRLFDG